MEPSRLFSMVRISRFAFCRAHPWSRARHRHRRVRPYLVGDGITDPPARERARDLRLVQPSRPRRFARDL
jgi:hypothetical protein